MSDTTKIDENEDLDEVPESEKTPVTIVTGFLGAGKTTLGKFDLDGYCTQMQTELMFALMGIILLH